MLQVQAEQHNCFPVHTTELIGYGEAAEQNPARLEQRMGRIHRYGQKHDPVIIVNLLAGQTREGRVLKKLLEKLELIRKSLRSDKVFDVVGRLFETVSLKAYLEMAATEDGARAAIDGIDGLLTEEQVKALEAREIQGCLYVFSIA
jgi:hypothetical protein